MCPMRSALPSHGPAWQEQSLGDQQQFVDAYLKAYPGKESAKGRQFALQ